MNLILKAKACVTVFAKENNLAGSILHASEDDKGIVMTFGNESAPYGGVHEILFDKLTNKCKFYNGISKENLDRTCRLKAIF